MSTERPNDLIPVDQAAKLVDRSVSSIRGWVRNNELTGYREDPTRPNNSRLLVSRAELLHVAGTTKDPNPGRPPATPVSVEVEPDRLRVVELEGKVAVLEARLAGAEALLESRGETLAAVKRTLADATDARDAAEARARGLEAELSALRAYHRLPAWRRLLAPPPAPAIPGDGN